MRFCSAEVFFLLSVLVWNVNNGVFGQGRQTKRLFSLNLDFLSRSSNVVVLKLRLLVVINIEIFLCSLRGTI